MRAIPTPTVCDVRDVPTVRQASGRISRYQKLILEIVSASPKALRFDFESNVEAHRFGGRVRLISRQMADKGEIGGKVCANVRGIGGVFSVYCYAKEPRT